VRACCVQDMHIDIFISYASRDHFVCISYVLFSVGFHRFFNGLNPKPNRTEPTKNRRLAVRNRCGKNGTETGPNRTIPRRKKCATDSKRTRDLSNTSMMSTYWFMKRTSTKTVEISKECTSFASDERFDMSLCSFRSSTSWFISSEIRRSSTWQSRSRSIRTRFNRESTFEFSTCRSTHDWNEVHTYEKFKKKWRNRSWSSRNCRFSFEERFFAIFECCTSSLFVRFSLTTSSFDTCSRIKNRKWSTNSQSYKIIVYETSSNRFESLRSRFWKLKRTSLSSICIWISCRFRSDIACKSQICRTSFVENAD
jgi:hypothetical protein